MGVAVPEDGESILVVGEYSECAGLAGVHPNGRYVFRIWISDGVVEFLGRTAEGSAGPPTEVPDAIRARSRTCDFDWTFGAEQLNCVEAADGRSLGYEVLVQMWSVGEDSYGLPIWLPMPFGPAVGLRVRTSDADPEPVPFVTPACTIDADCERLGTLTPCSDISHDLRACTDSEQVTSPIGEAG